MKKGKLSSNLRKIYIVGPEGSGKSTLAEILSKSLNIKHYGLDDVVWTRKYDRKRTPEKRLKKLNSIINKKQWITEGIFGGWTEPIFKKADIVIVLNLDYPLLVKNLIKRALFYRNKNEQEKVNLFHVLKVIRHVKKYRTRDHPKSYSGHMDMIKKYKARFIEIKNQRQLNDLLTKLPK